MKKQKIMIIAEAGVNHNGSLELAKKLVDVAADAGADYVKFQTYNTDDVITHSTPKLEYQIANDTKEESQYDMIKALELSQAEFRELHAHCQVRGIQFMSTPFDFGSLAFLTHDLNVSHIKIASNEITNAPLLLASARSQKPIILSTGMATLGEIEDALGVLAYGYLHAHDDINETSFRHAYYSSEGQRVLQQKVILLHCTSQYPAQYHNVNLKALHTIAAAFGLAVGYSDHTEGVEISVAAAAMGASVIEKHFTLSKTMVGPDHQASLSPDELKQWVQSIRNVEKAMGDGIKRPMDCEIENLKIMRRSLIAIDQIQVGEGYTPKNLAAKQPATGASPMRYWEYLKKQAEKQYEKDEIVQ